MVSNCTMAMSYNMTFHFSRSVPGGLLFNQWRVQTTGDLVGAIVSVFMLALLYEGLKTLREYLVFKDWQNWNSHRKRQRQCRAGRNSSSDQDEEEEEEEEGIAEDERTFVMADKRKSKRLPRRKKGFKYYTLSVTMHLIQSALHVVQVGYAYLLMLVAMTYNGWLFLSICFGAGVGYLMFAKSRHLMGNFRDQNGHCNH